MLQSFKRWLPAWLHVAVPACVMLLAVWPKLVEMREGEPPALLASVEFKLLDAYQRAAPRKFDPGLPVRVIDIDEATLAKIGQWPWPRTTVARLVERLTALGAAVIAFDAVFAEPDRTSPRNWVRLLPESGAARALREAAGRLPDHDRVLAKSMADSGRVVTGFALSAENNGLRPPSRATLVEMDCDMPKILGDDYAGATPNLPFIEEAAAGSGNFALGFDSDGVIRRVPLLYRLGEQTVPLLALEAMRVASRARTVAIKCAGFGKAYDWTGRPGVSSMKIQAAGCAYCAIPTDEKGRVWLRFTSTRDDPRRVISAWEVFEKGFDAARVRNAIIFVGTGAAGLRDLRSTPMNPHAAGVEIHAQVAEQILGGGFLRRPYWLPLAELIYLALLGVGLVLLLSRAGAAWSAVMAGAAVAAAFWLSWRAFVDWSYVLDPLVPSATALAVYFSSSLIGYLRAEAERRKIRDQFVRYMSPELVKQLADHPDRLKLGGEMREMTVLFSDIRGFTTISEQFDPEGLTRFINRYLTPMSDILLKEGAFIDKYMGDAIMAFWNAPVNEPDHAVKACRAALEMSRRLAILNDMWRAEASAQGKTFIPIRSGIGINTGRCCVGNMGSDQRFEYSVLGDDVNLASRLEGQSKNYGVDIVVGQNTAAKAPGFALLEMDRIMVKGKTVPTAIFALVGDEATALEEGFRALAERNSELLAAYRAQRWDEAESLARICRDSKWGLQKLYDLYLSRVAACRREPPPPYWDGVFRLSEK